MANPSRAKGTRWENELRELLRDVCPDVERAPLKGINDAGDFVNVPFPIEAKAHKVPKFLEWVRVIKRKAALKCLDDEGSLNPLSPIHRWWVVYCPDRRSKDTVGPVALMDAHFAIELLGAWLREKEAT
jgi:hypothetical protein